MVRESKQNSVQSLTETWNYLVWIRVCQIPHERLVGRSCGHGTNCDCEVIHCLCGDIRVRGVTMHVDDMTEDVERW